MPGVIGCEVMPFDPLRLAEETEAIVARGTLRKYYRVSRPGRWYGGIASSDCCGCNLRCIFCWSGAPRDRPGDVGRFYAPRQVFDELTGCARRSRYGQVRVSGNEPTLGRGHLMGLLELIDRTDYRFVLETNGIMLGNDPGYAEEISEFGCVHARVSLKGTTAEEFSSLTGAEPWAFELQLNALRNLSDAGVECHAAVMTSFSSEGSFGELVERLGDINPRLADEVEKEYLFLYPHVAARLKAAGMQPAVSYEPGKVPRELI